MSKTGKLSLINNLARPLVEEQGLMLWDLALEKEGSDWFLRVVMDGNRPVTLDDCEAVSRRLDKLLDEHDPIDHPYCLEVSSAGIGRKLKKPWHYQAFIGKQIEVLLIRPVDGERCFTGILKEYNDKMITVETGENIKEFNLSDASYVKAVDDILEDISDEQ